MTAAVDSTGIAATQPGNSETDEASGTEIMIPTMPNQLRIALRDGAHPSIDGHITASRAPMPSSKARV